MTAKKILLIDDDEDNRTLVEFSLKMKTNWEILAASGGIEGIVEAESKKPDAILLDLVMSDVDGLTVCEILKNNIFTCTIPIIFMTAAVSNYTLSKLETTRAEGTITKPIDAIALASQIADICDWRFPQEINPRSPTVI